MDTANTQLSTALLSKDCLLLLFTFLSPYFWRSSLVCQPSLRCTFTPISCKSLYRCSLPTCTGLKALFHLPPLPLRITACTSSTTTSVSGSVFLSCAMTRAFASHLLRVDGGILFFRLRRLSNRFGLRHLRPRRARR